MRLHSVLTENCSCIQEIFRISRREIYKRLFIHGKFRANLIDALWLKIAEELSILDENSIKSRIHTIRGVQVMLDRDLAELYEVPTKRLNEQARRNIERFPKDFMFQLTEKESHILRSQIATANPIIAKIRYLPYVFTEQGVANLSSVLSSKKAIQVNILIMRAFVAMRKFLASNAQVFHRLDREAFRMLDRL